MFEKSSFYFFMAASTQHIKYYCCIRISNRWFSKLSHLSFSSPASEIYHIFICRRGTYYSMHSYFIVSQAGCWFTIWWIKALMQLKYLITKTTNDMHALEATSWSLNEQVENSLFSLLRMSNVSMLLTSKQKTRFKTLHHGFFVE